MDGSRLQGAQSPISPSPASSTQTTPEPGTSEGTPEPHSRSNMAPDGDQDASLWSFDRVRWLLEAVKLQKASMDPDSHMFKGHQYNGFAAYVNTRSAGLQVTGSQCKTKWKTIKQHWGDWLYHTDPKHLSGWGFYPNGVPMEPSKEQGDQHFIHDPVGKRRCKRFRHVPPNHREMLEEIISSCGAVGVAAGGLADLNIQLSNHLHGN